MRACVRARHPRGSLVKPEEGCVVPLAVGDANLRGREGKGRRRAQRVRGAADCLLGRLLLHSRKQGRGKQQPTPPRRRGSRQGSRNSKLGAAAGACHLALTRACSACTTNGCGRSPEGSRRRSSARMASLRCSVTQRALFQRSGEGRGTQRRRSGSRGDRRLREKRGSGKPRRALSASPRRAAAEKHRRRN